MPTELSALIYPRPDLSPGHSKYAPMYVFTSDDAVDTYIVVEAEWITRMIDPIDEAAKMMYASILLNRKGNERFRFFIYRKLRGDVEELFEFTFSAKDSFSIQRMNRLLDVSGATPVYEDTPIFVEVGVPTGRKCSSEEMSHYFSEIEFPEEVRGGLSCFPGMNRMEVMRLANRRSWEGVLADGA